MNCLNRVEIQEYIDNELSEGRRAKAEKHLSLCNDCREIHRTALIDKNFINGLLDDLNKNINIQNGEFVYPNRKQERLISRFVITLIAAASILTFIFLFQKKPDVVSENTQESEKILKEFYEGKDLNKMWHEWMPANLNYENFNPIDPDINF